MLWWHLLLRVVFVYFFVLLSLRVMGKREIGKLSVFDVVVSIMIAEVSAVGLEESKEPLWRTLLIIATLVGLQIGVSYLTLSSHKLRDLVEGRPAILITNGKIDEDAMRRMRYSIGDLLMQLREKNILNIDEVEFAILETTGKLSVFPKKQEKAAARGDLSLQNPPQLLPLPVIIDGKVLDRNLESVGKTRFWLKAELDKHGCPDYKDIFFASLDTHGSLYVDVRGD